MSDLVAQVLCPARSGRCGNVLAELRRDDEGFFLAPTGFTERTPSAIAVDGTEDVWIMWNVENAWGQSTCAHEGSNPDGHMRRHLYAAVPDLMVAMTGRRRRFAAVVRHFGSTTTQS